MPATTPIYGFPYPLGTDPLGQGAQDIQDLATAVESKFVSSDASMGLIKITPTSVTGTGASIAANGDVVVISGSNSFVVNGIFNATYLSYRIMISEYTASTDAGIIVAMGSAIGGTSHNWAGPSFSATTMTQGGATATTNWDIGIVAGAGLTSGCAMDIYNPFTVSETSFNSLSVDSRGSFQGRIRVGGVSGNTSYTGMAFATNTGANFTSVRVSVYGYN
jgi:hypothetical protein